MIMSRLYKDKSALLNGFVNLYKTDDMTSSDAVCIARGALSKATGSRQKVGHLGTLDPLATGVLPICLGNATKLFDLLAFKRKKYIATFVFGTTTDTLDRGGKITSDNGKIPTLDEIRATIPRFVGEISQIPPLYSSKSVDGKRAYSYARQGVQIELPPKNVIVYSISADNSTNDTEGEYRFEIECGGGTYIRSLARDIAKALETVGYMSSLERTVSGAFNAENAVNISEFRNNPLPYVLPVEYALKNFASYTLTETETFKAVNGVNVPFDAERKTGVTDEPESNKTTENEFYFKTYSNEGKLLGIGKTDGRELRLTIRL